jgi:MFS family permease
MTPKIVVHGTEKLPNHDDAHSKYNLYGWRNFRIGGLLSRPVFAYIILCTCNFIQNFSVNGANNAVISTLERVFYMDSVQSGLFLALYDVATVFSSPIVGYLGTRYSSPIFFSLNMIIIGFGNIMIASSNFVNQGKMFNLNADFLDYLATYDDVLYQCDKDPFNSMNVTDLSCLKQERLTSASQSAKLVLYFGNFVNGIGSVALFTIGIAYIERIFPRDKAAYCQGIYFAVGTVGGALGIIVTGRFLSIFTKLTPRKKLPSWLTPSNPLWIGCWWLPYYIYGSLSFLVGLFVSGLPNYEIPGKKHEHIDTLVQASSDDKDAKTTSKKFIFVFLLNLFQLIFRSFACSRREHD